MYGLDPWVAAVVFLVAVVPLATYAVFWFLTRDESGLGRDDRGRPTPPNAHGPDRTVPGNNRSGRSR